MNSHNTKEIPIIILYTILSPSAQHSILLVRDVDLPTDHDISMSVAVVLDNLLLAVPVAQLAVAIPVLTMNASLNNRRSESVVGTLPVAG